jgi:glycosyltransferase involved in cell wall biosynthesis
MTLRLALATTHPIQYQVPWFRALAARPEVELEVGFAWLPDAAAQGVGFGVPFAWDLPLLDGYRWRELERGRGRPELSRFGGLRLRRPGSWLDAWRADALIVTGWNARALVEVALAARRRGIPVLARGDSRGGLRRPLAARLAHRVLLRLYAGFLVVGERNRAFYEERGVAAERLFSCPHFVDNERFAHAATAAAPRRAELRARWGVPENAVCTLFAGKIAPVKDLDTLLAALARACVATPGLHLLVVGDGGERARLERAARERALPVGWAGFLNQSEIPAAYAAADALVLPSRSETWGLVVNEAMACGLPAIVSDAAGCAPDLVRDGETGFTFPCGDAPALAARLAALAAEPGAARAMGERARALVFAEYSVARAVEGTLAALAAVTGGRASRGEGRRRARP